MSSCFWAHLMGFLSRHVTATSCGCGCHVAATWLPRHVAVAAVWFETEETTVNCTVCTRDELSGTWMAQWRHRGNEERDPPVGTIATREVLSISPLRFQFS